MPKHCVCHLYQPGAHAARYIDTPLQSLLLYHFYKLRLILLNKGGVLQQFETESKVIHSFTAVTVFMKLTISDYHI